jgi:DNA polymerase-3 subunit alpha
MLLARSYSHHSLLSAVPKIPNLIKKAKELGYTTIALTDEDTGSSLIEFYEECEKNEIKCCLAATLRIPNISNSKKGFGNNAGMSKIAILTKNEAGYKALLKLISIARTEREKPNYHLLFEDILKFKDENGDLPFWVLLAGNDHEAIINLRENKSAETELILDKYVTEIGSKNILVELAMPMLNENLEENKNLNQKLADLCKTKNVRYLASPAPRYLEDFQEEAFRVVLAIRGQVRLSDIQLQRKFSLPSKAELAELYNYLPESLETQDLEDEINIKIATDYDKHASDAFFPKFHLPTAETPANRLRWETYIGLLNRFSPFGESFLELKEKYPYEKLDELVKYAKNLQIEPTKLLGYPDGYWSNEQIENLENQEIPPDNIFGYKFTQEPAKIVVKKHKNIVDYIDRLEYELDIIVSRGYSEYFLVFGDIMRFCRETEIVTNTRGSAAGSLVGYLNEIVILDPLLYDLPFERFLNPFRPSPPDIDGDFADDRREDVIQYIKNKYGSDKVSQIITFGTMLPRAAVRDVGRVLGISYGKCDKLSKLIPTAPQGKKTTFDYAFETSQEVKDVYENDPDSKRIIDIARIIEGNYRHASSHAAGVIISPTVLTDYAPIQWDSEHKMVVVQYDMKIAEKAGMIKMDILGITNLAILGNAIAITQNRRKVKIDLLKLNTKEEKAFQILAKGRTMGTFQLSGAAMTRYLVALEPTKVQDLMAMVALYRPGPMDSIPEYIARKKNPAKVKYLVPQMKDWMEPSYGILVYQDDLIYTAIYLAGYNWGEADVLRKGMGKKIQAVIEEQHPKFVNGCVEYSGIEKETAEYIWSLIVPFAAYGFNKAHSASYGMVAYWTAYMKALYTVEFMTAYMTSEGNNLDKIAAAIKECESLGIKVMPPDVNKSMDNFSIEDDKTIRYGLTSVKNLGSDVIKFIINNREKDGEYKTLDEFLDRVSGFQGFNKRSVEALIVSGSLDDLGQKYIS